jgi:serine/threonine protein kinase
VDLREVINAEGKLTLVMEYLDYDLKKFLDMQKAPPSEKLIKSYAYQMIAGLCSCHCHRIIHRDMKPQNLLINQAGYLKLADFGLARAFTIPLRNYTHEVVTLWYRAPEILLGSKLYSVSIDVWSTGCIIAEMMTKKPLFPGDSEVDELFSIFRVLGTPTEEVFPGVTQLPAFSATFPKWRPKKLPDVLHGVEQAGVDLVQQMLKYDPATRISSKAALDHPYFDDLPPEVKAKCRPVEIEPNRSEQ